MSNALIQIKRLNPQDLARLFHTLILKLGQNDRQKATITLFNNLFNNAEMPTPVGNIKAMLAKNFIIADLEPMKGNYDKKNESLKNSCTEKRTP